MKGGALKLAKKQQEQRVKDVYDFFLAAHAPLSPYELSFLRDMASHYQLPKMGYGVAVIRNYRRAIHAELKRYHMPKEFQLILPLTHL